MFAGAKGIEFLEVGRVAFFVLGIETLLVAGGLRAEEQAVAGVGGGYGVVCVEGFGTPARWGEDGGEWVGGNDGEELGGRIASRHCSDRLKASELRRAIMMREPGCVSSSFARSLLAAIVF